jgi:hypothetical protein
MPALWDLYNLYEHDLCYMPVKENKMLEENIIKNKETFIVINRKRLEELNNIYSNPSEFIVAKSVVNLLDSLYFFKQEYEEKVGKKLNQEYIVCNTDEPYAEEVLKIILEGERKKEKDKERKVLPISSLGHNNENTRTARRKI